MSVKHRALVILPVNLAQPYDEQITSGGAAAGIGSFSLSAVCNSTMYFAGDEVLCKTESQLDLKESIEYYPKTLPRPQSKKPAKSVQRVHLCF